MRVEIVDRVEEFDDWGPPDDPAMRRAWDWFKGEAMGQQSKIGLLERLSIQANEHRWRTSRTEREHRRPLTGLCGLTAWDRLRRDPAIRMTNLFLGLAPDAQAVDGSIESMTFQGVMFRLSFDMPRDAIDLCIDGAVFATVDTSQP